MKKRFPLPALALLAVLAAPAARAGEPPYALRDTTGFPPPAAGTARVLVARERLIEQGLKPEFVFVDFTPVGMLPQKSGVAAEVPAGWHRVWLGRGSNTGVWMNFADGGRYLIRLRENLQEGRWRADLVRDARDGYAEFAIGKGMKLAITSASGMGALERDLKKTKKKYDAKMDSIDRANAIAKAQLPIGYSEAWYQDLLAPARIPMDYEQAAGRLVLDATALRFVRGDSTVLEIPRAAIESVRYGGHKDNRPNPWIKVGYRVNGEEKGATFAHTKAEVATENYNRLFAELERGLPTP